MTIRCEKCGKIIDVIVDIEIKHSQDYPAFLHGKCYREIVEKEWMNDELYSG